MADRDIYERFQRETAKHEMTVLHSDGLYRHLRFRNPEHGTYWFDIVTWPGNLVIRGDIKDTYAFSRHADMFEFFRGPVGRINPHYWAQKLTTDRDSVEKYDPDSFERQVKEHVADAIRDRVAPRGISRAIKEMFAWGNISYEDGARAELESFEYGAAWKATCSCRASEEFKDETSAVIWRSRHILSGSREIHRSSVERVEGFRFEDTSEWDFRDYDWSFLWALHGIVWGISRYDAAKAAEQAQQAEAVPA
ncbi:hypothetical protein [Microbispora rosea]|uniref:hypothetical protein n=1 Tax=Microbispora rosea TaxID=58117 RepID=UPI0037BA3BC3